MTSQDESPVEQLRESLREAQVALEHSREQLPADKAVRSRLSRQIDLLSHLVLMSDNSAPAA